MREEVTDRGQAGLRGLPEAVDITLNMEDHTAVLQLQKSKVVPSNFDVILAGQGDNSNERVKYSGEVRKSLSCLWVTKELQ